MIKLSSPGPILFKQKRTGLYGHDFECFKFRTMKVNAQADTLQAVKDDPRKTRIGDFLRRTNLDEFPQFVNVLLGDMSVVGPRPHMLKHTEQYSALIDKYMAVSYTHLDVYKRQGSPKAIPPQTIRLRPISYRMSYRLRFMGWTHDFATCRVLPKNMYVFSKKHVRLFGKTRTCFRNLVIMFLWLDL